MKYISKFTKIDDSNKTDYLRQLFVGITKSDELYFLKVGRYTAGGDFSITGDTVMKIEEERAVENTIESIEQLYEDGDFDINYIDNDYIDAEWFQTTKEESNRFYAEDIAQESADGYPNRLAEELVERGIVDEEDVQKDDFDSEDYIDEFVDEMNYDQDPIDWFIDSYGEEEYKRVLIEQNLLDVEELVSDMDYSYKMEFFDNSTLTDDVVGKDGDTYLFQAVGGGQNRDELNNLKVSFLPESFINQLKKNWDNYHLKELPKKDFFPKVTQDEEEILKYYVNNDLDSYAKGGKVRKSPFKVGDMVYSYQNPNHKMRVSFVEDRGVEDGVDYGWGYKVALKTDEDGKYDPKGKYSKSSKWMSQNSVSKTKKTKYAKGGYIPYEDVREFEVYVTEFYGKDGIYKKDYDGGFTKQEIIEAVSDYIKDPKTEWGGGDSVDRELMRDRYLIPSRYPNRKTEFKEKGGKMENVEVKQIVYSQNGEYTLDEYRKLSNKDLMGFAPMSLYDAKNKLFEINDSAIEYEEDIQDIKSVDELADFVYENDLGNIENTYNYSWWGGTRQYIIVNNDGDNFDADYPTMVFMSYHRGGDVRGNYEKYEAFNIDDYFYEDFPIMYDRMTVIVEKDGKSITADTEDMEGYDLYINESDFDEFEEGDNTNLDEIGEKLGFEAYKYYEAGGTLPTPFGQAGLVGETGTMNEMDLFAMGGDLPQGVHQYYANTYNPAYPTPHGYAKGGEIKEYFNENLEVVKNYVDDYNETAYAIRDKKTLKRYVVDNKANVEKNLRVRGFSQKEASRILNNAKTDKSVNFFAKGGKTQGYNDRLDESLGNRNSVEPLMMQSYKDRRDESKGMEKSMGRRPYSSVGTMDKMAKGGIVKVGDLVVITDESVSDEGAKSNYGKVLSIKKEEIYDGAVNTLVKVKTNDGKVNTVNLHEVKKLYAKGGNVNAGIETTQATKLLKGKKVKSVEILSELQKETQEIIINFDDNTQLSAYHIRKGIIVDLWDKNYDRTRLKNEFQIEEAKKQASKILKEFSAQNKMAKGGMIPFSTSNLYFNGFGKDSNGNSVIKVSFPNSRAFSIQTNGDLPKTHSLKQEFSKIDNLSEKDLKIVEKEVNDYVKEFGSDSQIKKLNTYAKGGKTQGYNDKLDESLGNTKGKRSTKEQNYKDRRNESEAMEKKDGKRKYARVKTMDKGNRKKRKTPMTLAKAIRKDGEKWQDAVKRAVAMMKK
jgi:hypothetical protein